MADSKDKFYDFVCSGLGLGHAPIASGTVGSLPALGIYIIVRLIVPREMELPVLIGFLIASCAVCVLLGPWAEGHWKRKDPSQFVLDEWAGFFLTVVLFRTESILLSSVWAFIATRVFDILKPSPAGRLEFLPGGWGILTDDLVASVYAGALLNVLLLYVPIIFKA